MHQMGRIPDWQKSGKRTGNGAAPRDFARSRTDAAFLLLTVMFAIRLHEQRILPSRHYASPFHQAIPLSSI
ncbi:hypothetical protein D3C73_1414960 [compost metagenome]